VAAWLNRYHRALQYAICVLLLFVGLANMPEFLAHRVQRISSQSLDWLMRNRALPPQPDGDVVILDIDERSLARLAPLAGRWPWPRTVLGEVLDELQRQGAAAVVFDILFADPDVLNPAADEAFAEAVARSRIAWFPMLRLDAAADAKSNLRSSVVPGLVAARGANSEARVGLVLPFFGAAVESGRLGTHNVHPDADGRIRLYRLWEEKEGWQIPSLPFALARSQGWKAPETPEIRINFMSEHLAHSSVSFADLWEDLQRKQRSRPRDEFRGKIVLVGATAPSLFDVKATPLAAVHPGVHVLATVIDNLKNDGVLRDASGLLRSVLMAVFLLGTMAATAVGVAEADIQRLNAILQPIFLLIAWVSLQTGPWVVDLTQLVGLGIALIAYTALLSALERHLEGNGGQWFRSAPLAAGPLWICLYGAATEAAAREWRSRFLATPGARVVRRVLTPDLPGPKFGSAPQLGMSPEPVECQPGAVVRCVDIAEDPAERAAHIQGTVISMLGEWAAKHAERKP
jgi:CHASE2 domain-containing sensor protein